ncbi:MULTISPECIES: F0F1 ATP synthase subunit delta [Lysobacter]|uniref:ATP synthase subunit delta n=2 Tax=Lysobacter TaxID=68 RepID=A0A0S2DBY5_LYSEN|nr:MULTISPECIES: F0F1 ATP synthase subunit delta [Lysobacter]ALN56044.1 ATP synthase F1, delta subunit [Lysobacter enzymogenes]QCW24977.1 F0F1 ATP synthase subunit delta [Lysobacter enzymogenes]QQQ00559.1 F0F1 ATP synthase subunit delta [Lysobacter enzymogenes]UZW60000.1 F0F1 ATP synthase subunit delta [Lysobacter enzymogenes]WMT03839.1 F0F1 ATP synthase subunit delta [Lysobacter yananisis]
MSQNLTLARPYARAAFALARDAGRTADWSQALAFSARVAADPQVQSVLGHPRLSVSDAVALVAIDHADEPVQRFLTLLADNRRLALLPEIAGLFEELRADADRVVKAKVTSASDLPAAELDSIKAALVKRFGRQVEIETAIDASLIGGAVIDAGEVVIDGSLKGKLARLQTALAG